MILDPDPWGIDNILNTHWFLVLHCIIVSHCYLFNAFSTAACNITTLQQQYIKRNWEIHKRFRNSYLPWFWNQTNNKGCTIYSYINLEYWQGRLWWLYNGWINTTSFTQSQSLHSCSCVLGELISLVLLSVSWEEDNWEPGSLFLKSYGDILGDNDVCITSCGLCPQRCTMLSSYRYVVCVNIDVNVLISQWIDINSTSGAPNTAVL